MWTWGPPGRTTSMRRDHLEMHPKRKVRFDLRTVGLSPSHRASHADPVEADRPREEDLRRGVDYTAELQFPEPRVPWPRLCHERPPRTRVGNGRHRSTAIGFPPPGLRHVPDVRPGGLAPARQCTTRGRGFTRAVVQYRYGSPDVLEVADVDKPVPSEGEVLVRVRRPRRTPTTGTKCAATRTWPAWHWGFARPAPGPGPGLRGRSGGRRPERAADPPRRRGVR